MSESVSIDKVPDRTILVSHIPAKTTEEELSKHFSQECNGGGEIAKLEFPFDENWSKAYIIFEDIKVLQTVICRRHVLKNNVLVIQPYLEKVPVFEYIDAVLSKPYATYVLAHPAVIDTLDKEYCVKVVKVCSKAGTSIRQRVKVTGHWQGIEGAKRHLYALLTASNASARGHTQDSDLEEYVVISNDDVTKTGINVDSGEKKVKYRYDLKHSESTEMRGASKECVVETCEGRVIGSHSQPNVKSTASQTVDISECNHGTQEIHNNISKDRSGIEKRDQNETMAPKDKRHISPCPTGIEAKPDGVAVDKKSFPEFDENEETESAELERKSTKVCPSVHAKEKIQDIHVPSTDENGGKRPRDQPIGTNTSGGDCERYLDQKQCKLDEGACIKQAAASPEQTRHTTQPDPNVHQVPGWPIKEENIDSMAPSDMRTGAGVSVQKTNAGCSKAEKKQLNPTSCADESNIHCVSTQDKISGEEQQMESYSEGYHQNEKKRLMSATEGQAHTNDGDIAKVEETAQKTDESVDKATIADTVLERQHHPNTSQRTKPDAGRANENQNLSQAGSDQYHVQGGFNNSLKVLNHNQHDVDHNQITFGKTKVEIEAKMLLNANAFGSKQQHENYDDSTTAIDPCPPQISVQSSLNGMEKSTRTLAAQPDVDMNGMEKSTRTRAAQTDVDMNVMEKSTRTVAAQTDVDMDKITNMMAGMYIHQGQEKLPEGNTSLKSTDRNNVEPIQGALNEQTGSPVTITLQTKDDTTAQTTDINQPHTENVKDKSLTDGDNIPTFSAAKLDVSGSKRKGVPGQKVQAPPLDAMGKPKRSHANSRESIKTYGNEETGGQATQASKTYQNKESHEEVDKDVRPKTRTQWYQDTLIIDNIDVLDYIYAKHFKEVRAIDDLADRSEKVNSSGQCEITLTSRSQRQLHEAKELFIDLYQKVFYDVECSLIPHNLSKQQALEVCKHFMADHKDTYTTVGNDGVHVVIQKDSAEERKLQLIGLLGVQIKKPSLRRRRGNSVKETAGDKPLQNDNQSGFYKTSDRGVYSSSKAGTSFEYVTNQGVTIKIFQKDITCVKVSAIVNAANEMLQHGSGVARAISDKAGEALRQDCKLYIQRKGPLQVGEAIYTNAGNGNLECHYVIHAVGPRWYQFKNKSKCIEKLKTTFSNCFKVANEKLEVTSIAVPAISSGVFGVPKDKCANALFESVMNFSEKSTTKGQLREILIVNNDEETTTVMEQTFRTRLHCHETSSTPRTGSNDQYDGTMNMYKEPGGRMAPWNKEDNQNPPGLKHANQAPSSIYSSNGRTDVSKPFHPQTKSPQNCSFCNGRKIPERTFDCGHRFCHQCTVSMVHSQHCPFCQDDKPNESAVGLVTVQADAEVHKETDMCPICLDEVDNPHTLPKCNHTFCKPCIDACFEKSKPVCPTCGTVYGRIIGTQPDGRMDVTTTKDRHLPGYERDGIIAITYTFPNGRQGNDHPSPGSPYTGITRGGYLPDNKKGQKVVRLLRKAFNQRLTFTIGRSTTTGREGVITWNDIHHKTSISGGPQQFGYPDAGYLDRVLDELAAKGISE